MSRTIVPMAWLTVVWMALWESFTIANLIGGLAVAALVVGLIPPGHQVQPLGLRPLAAVKLGAFFLWKLVEASVLVAWEIATPGDRTHPAVVSVPLHTLSPGIVTSVANMVSLTPGTLTLEVDPDTMTLYIHVLHYQSAETTSKDVYQLERLTVAAFPTDTRTT